MQGLGTEERSCDCVVKKSLHEYSLDRRYTSELPDNVIIAQGVRNANRANCPIIATACTVLSYLGSCPILGALALLTPTPIPEALARRASSAEDTANKRKRGETYFQTRLLRWFVLVKLGMSHCCSISSGLRSFPPCCGVISSLF